MIRLDSFKRGDRSNTERLHSDGQIALFVCLPSPVLPRRTVTAAAIFNDAVILLP